MPEREYQTISLMVSAAGVCKREQLMSADQYNSFVSYQMQRRPAQYQYAHGKVWNMVQTASAKADAEEFTDAARSKAQIGCAQLANAADETSRMRQTPLVPQVPCEGKRRADLQRG